MTKMGVAMMKAHEICARAAELTGVAREHQHGSKRENHIKIATMWNAFMAIRRDPAAPLSPADVALMMVCLKVARTQHGAHNIDDYVDAAGYAGVAGEIAEHEALAEAAVRASAADDRPGHITLVMGDGR